MEDENKNKNKNFRVTNNNSVDMHVGKRVRLRRTLLGLSQEQLGDALNLTFQQVQKYECGTNRISASRLWDISQILDTSISYFFEDMSPQTKLGSPRKVNREEQKLLEDDFERDPISRRETLELVRTYYSISEPNVRKRLAELIKIVAGTVNEE
tara:strand:+ start:291 stop:752 length:462 start_codon:yes stop_codon:yes gene_type:complete